MVRRCILMCLWIAESGYSWKIKTSFFSFGHESIAIQGFKIVMNLRILWATKLTSMAPQSENIFDL